MQELKAGVTDAAVEKHVERFPINDLFADFIGDKNVKLKIENVIER